MTSHHRIGRRGLGALLVVGAVLMLVYATELRTVEAGVTSRLVAAVTSGQALSARNVIFFGIGSGTVFGLMITPMCSNIVLTVPLLILAGLLLSVSRMRAVRSLLGLGVGLAIAVGTNMLRYASAAFALQVWGVRGFDVVHQYAGSLAVIVGFGAGIVLCVRIASGGRAAVGAGRHS